LLVGESGCADVVLAEVEGDYKGEERLVVECLFVSEYDLCDLLYFYLVCLDNLRYKSLCLCNLDFHFLVIVDLHQNDLQLVVN
jgi:hypothetical protein